MLCSLPNSKSSSSWLDRLHTLKGFTNLAPPNPNPNANPSPSPDPLPLSHNSNPNSTSSQMQVRPVDAMSSVLADLFVMDPPNPPAAAAAAAGIGAKRGLRKQPSPRICILSRTRKSRGFPPSASTNGVTELKSNKRSNKLKVTKKNKQVKNNRNKEKRGSETGPASNAPPTASKAAPGFIGRTEATVIDTSTPGWKSAKILIRKGSIWKIRDKKQRNAGLKKRKRFGLTSNREKEAVPLEEPSDALDQGDHHEEPVDPIQVSIKRLKCSKLPSVPEAAKSIALHLKVRTNGKKKGLSISNNSPKEKVQP